jgi:sugar O-acyltransferase (sialic acid O-acetyltransferase NeuD family)
MDCFNLLGLLDARQPLGHVVLGYEVIGRDSDLPALVQRQGVTGVVVAIGDNWLRAKVAANLRAAVPSIEFPNAIHPAAQLAKEVQLGEGNVIVAGAVVNSGTSIGNFCLLNTNCSVDHDCRLGDYASFAPNSCAGGNVELGEYTAVGLGANIIHGRQIGAHTVIGAGATALKDLPPNVVAYGTPARTVRSRQPGDRYL